MGVSKNKGFYPKSSIKEIGFSKPLFSPSILGCFPENPIFLGWFNTQIYHKSPTNIGPMTDLVP